jgi:hypothetical protein
LVVTQCEKKKRKKNKKIKKIKKNKKMNYGIALANQTYSTRTSRKKMKKK